MAAATEPKKGDLVKFMGYDAEVMLVTRRPTGSIQTIKVKYTDKHGKLRAAVVYPSELDA